VTLFEVSRRWHHHAVVHTRAAQQREPAKRPARWMNGVCRPGRSRPGMAATPNFRSCARVAQAVLRRTWSGRAARRYTPDNNPVRNAPGSNRSSTDTITEAADLVGQHRRRQGPSSAHIGGAVEARNPGRRQYLPRTAASLTDNRARTGRAAKSASRNTAGIRTQRAPSTDARRDGMG